MAYVKKGYRSEGKQAAVLAAIEAGADTLYEIEAGIVDRFPQLTRNQICAHLATLRSRGLIEIVGRRRYPGTTGPAASVYRRTERKIPAHG